MKPSTAFKLLLVVSFSGFIAFSAETAPAAFDSPPATPGSLNSPLPVPTFAPPTPVPTPPPSQPAQRARQHLAQQARIPLKSLAVVTDHATEYRNLKRRFQVVTLVDTRRGGRFYDLLVDLDTDEVIRDTEAVWRAEQQAATEKYGRLQPILYERLQAMTDQQVVTVTLWVAAGSAQALADQEAAALATLTAKYPEARAVVLGSDAPLDVSDPARPERIQAEYEDLMDANVAGRVQPLLQTLQAQGVKARTYEGIPALTVPLSKAAILLLEQRPDVGAINLADSGKYRLALDSAHKTNGAPAVWARGYDGTGIDIAILETDNVDFSSDSEDCPAGSNNCFLHPGLVRTGIVSDTDPHATLIASAAASHHELYKGMAPGARVMSAGMTGFDPQDAIDALTWALNNNADVVNYSAGWCSAFNQMQDADRLFDYHARWRDRLIVVAAGNDEGVCASADYVTSPAKGWNVLSVGAYSDANDEMWISSAWRNPDSPNSDHEKPEVVAPGVDIVAIGLNGQPFPPFDGTSYAAPQVAGVAALLMDRDFELRFRPEVARAILMASATHNIDGPTGIPTGIDLKDGAGGINASVADEIAQHHSFGDPCKTSCWWSVLFNNTSFPVGSYRYYRFNASAGDRIRVAIAWWSNADCPSADDCQYDRLDTDLHLGVFDPDGQLAPGAWSASHDNNYELVDFVAAKTGTHQIGVYKQRSDEPNNELGIALRLPYHVYVSAVMNN
ncbi:MAG TPA: S8 family serine peptidase [Anaerolineae bacterium]|nr:S8 family serine peptidase [Anaerolineae bacterium]